MSVEGGEVLASLRKGTIRAHFPARQVVARPGPRDDLALTLCESADAYV
jgi:hypothetical protein